MLSCVYEVWVLLLLLAAAQRSQAQPVDQGNKKKPNFLYIMFDDLDYHYNTTHPVYMPALHKYVVEPGMTLKNFFVSSPECCPSRSTYFVGRYAHNHNVTSASAPYGAYPKFRANNLDDDYLPGWLQGAGYSTYYLGKFLNHYDPKNDTHHPYNWTWFEALVDASTYFYYLPELARDGAPGVRHPGVYQADLLADKAEQMIDDAVARGKPFYLQVAPAAPHDSFTAHPSDDKWFVAFRDPQPAKRHEGLYKDIVLPKPPNFNERDNRDKCATMRNLPLLNETLLQHLDEYYRNRLRTIKSGDEMLERIMLRMMKYGLLDNTYVIVSSDNGYHLGAHRVGSGKFSTFEEDARIPAFIRGPGIKAGSVHLQMSSMPDLTPTVMELAGIRLRPDLDGAPIKLFSDTIKQPVTNERRDSVLVETWGNNGDQLTSTYIYNSSVRTVRVCNTEVGWLPASPAAAPQWPPALGAGARRLLGAAGPGGDGSAPMSGAAAAAALPLLPGLQGGRRWLLGPSSTQKTYCWKYMVWCTGERDVYDLQADPWELRNQYSNFQKTASGRRLISRLDAVVSAMAPCKGAECMTPYRVIHGKNTTVTSLAQAMATRYDALYNSLPPYKWYECLLYYSDQNEYSWAEDKK